MKALSASEFSKYRCVVVGSGFFGAVMAERVASELGLPVLVLEKRSHIGGNSYSELDAETGIEVHKYGSHIFHTSSKEVWEYINRFTSFNSYVHRVRTKFKERSYPIPINLDTINSFFGRTFSGEQAREFISHEAAKERQAEPANFEQKAISLIGRDLYQAFIKGYSEKQWETDLKKLPASIITRLPVRFDQNDRYFDDTWEGIPLDGYTKIFEKLLCSKLIEVRTGVDFFDLKPKLTKETLVVYTGPIDRYFNYQHGTLGWRTLDFEQEQINQKDFQGSSVINYAEREIPYTRIHEFRHYHPERVQNERATVIYKEFSRFAKQGEEPYYPIGTAEDKAIFESYKAEMAKCKNVIFGGRLATYKYLDMHQVIGAALTCFEREVKPRLTLSPSDLRSS